MPTPVKSMAGMAKHMTQNEIEAREKAETEFMPSRLPSPPRGFSKKTEERKIWDRVLADMEGYAILDSLDADVLEIYCRQLVRLASLRELFDSVKIDDPPIKTLLALSAEIKGTEGTILSYATKLGLTPEGRARLARRAAEQEPEDPDGDLFA